MTSTVPDDALVINLAISHSRSNGASFVIKYLPRAGILDGKTAYSGEVVRIEGAVTSREQMHLLKALGTALPAEMGRVRSTTCFADLQGPRYGTHRSLGTK